MSDRVSTKNDHTPRIVRSMFTFGDPSVAPEGCEGMSDPFRCRWCGAVYDLAHVEVTARYSDCSVWKSPCCKNTADDRDQRWGGGGTRLKRRVVTPPGSSTGGDQNT